MISRPSLFLLIWVAAATQLAAQDPVKTVPTYGRLTTPAAAPVPARVIVALPAGCCECSCREKGGDYYCCSDKSRICCAGLTVTATTGENGDFKLNLPPGKYDLFVDSVASGSKLADVTVIPGQSLMLDLQLTLDRLFRKMHRKMHKD
jgi:hypothetical protein